MAGRDAQLFALASRWLPRKRWRRYAVACAALFAGLVLAVELALRITPFDVDALFTGETSSALFDRDGQLLRVYLATDEQWRIPVPLAEVSPWVVKATLAAEDQRFWLHGGVDLLAIVRATVQNVLARRIVSGASTITMQVVGFSEGRDRTFQRKVRQIWRALQLERHATKEEILELYLTNAPYGGNLCGIEAAARRYFGKSAGTLTAGEAAFLAGIPQAPSRYRPDRHPNAAWHRMQYVLARMREEGVLSDDDFRRLAAQRPEVKVTSMPVRAPHFCDMLHRWHPTEPRIMTTLDADTQSLAEHALAEAMTRLAPMGVSNGAVVVLHNPSGEVRALVGSTDYWNQATAGQVNGALATRSAGSSLKPLIYAAAFDYGVLLPTSTLYDVPAMFLDYAPENFDRTWRGLVRADKALAWSLNIPAMEVLERVGVARMQGVLEASGIRTVIASRQDYGLSLAIGTCGARLLELSNAYAALARGGRLRSIRVRHDNALISSSRTLTAARRRNERGSKARRKPITTDSDPVTSGAIMPPPPIADVPLFSPGACYWVTRALSDPALRSPEDIAPELRGFSGVAWKTGTSNGYRDAWTIAYDPEYTVGVWIGNFDARPSPALIGARAAAPVALSILQQMRAHSESPVHAAAPVQPTDLVPSVLCAISGELATADCPTTCLGQRLALNVRGAGWADGPHCKLHRRARVDNETGELLCSQCPAERPWREQTFTFWPAPVAAWLRAHGADANLPPPHYHACVAAGVRDIPPPRIKAPRAEEVFVVSSARDLRFQKLALEAIAPSPTQRLFWFLDNDLLAVGRPNEAVFWVPRTGIHVLRCVDDRGGADAVRFSVLVE